MSCIKLNALTVGPGVPPAAPPINEVPPTSTDEPNISVLMPGMDTPETTKHIIDAMAEGKAKILTYRSKARDRG
jgi:hypothetical protein